MLDKEDRENGDYEVFSVIDKEEAETAVSEAEAFVYEMEKYLKSLGIPL